MTAWLSLGALALGWLLWEAAGRLVALAGLPVAPLLQQAGLFAQLLGALDAAWTRLIPSPSGDDHDPSR